MSVGNSTESGWAGLDSTYGGYKLAMAIIALCSTVYLQIIRNKQYRIITELWLGGFLLFSFLTASNALSFYVDAGTDTISVHSFRLLLAALLAQAVAAHLNKNSGDQSVHICLTISNILMRSILLLCFLYGLSTIHAMSDFACVLAIIVLIPVLFGDIRELTISLGDGHLNGETVGDPISFHLSIDAMISFLFGAGVMAFPDMFIQVMDANCASKEVSLLCTQTYGCVIISGAVLSFASLTFKEIQDATNTLIAKTVIYLPTLLMMVTNDLKSEHLPMMAIVGALAFNAGLAICRPEQ